MPFVSSNCCARVAESFLPHATEAYFYILLSQCFAQSPLRSLAARGVSSSSLGAELHIFHLIKPAQNDAKISIGRSHCLMRHNAAYERASLIKATSLGAYCAL